MNAATTETTAASPVLCCYEGCTRVANELDDDGDRCCEHCLWQVARETEFVELHNLTDGASFDEDTARRYEALMAERGWTVTVREPRRGEAEGHTYYAKDDGTLQILGFSISVPDAYSDDSRHCYEAVCSGADKRECEERAREDIAAAFGEWDRECPLSWTADEMVCYSTDGNSMDERASIIRARVEYGTAVERILPAMLATERQAFEQRAVAHWVARVSLPGTQSFGYTVHDSEDEAQAVIDELEASADTEADRQAARQSAVVRGDRCLWDTWQDGRLIYADLVRAL